jgi:trans-aconitate methyltransferase
MNNITDNYVKSLQNLHQEDKSWGKRKKFPEMIFKLIDENNISSILDYGCGKGDLTSLLKELYPTKKIVGWDPAFNKIDELPEKVDMIITTDVLEHIEPELLDHVLTDLINRSQKLVYHFIACYSAVAKLDDGRNAHLIVKTPDWWQDKMDNLDAKIIYENSFSFIKPIKTEKKRLAVTNYEVALMLL